MAEAQDQNELLDFNEIISKNYLSYALSTIMSRSLPDVRDGLKPVHRRILYAMHGLKLDPKSAYKKCARVVGDVIGKYHPHGDVAVYDTLVRLAQSFALRYPLVDGQGNFGSIDGDNAAAMRYTESRMTDIALCLIEDLDKETVEFKTTYDNSDFEPTLFPAAFPNLLANGSEGIAVGMATSIPPHNLHELCDALLYMIDNKEATTEDIMQFVQGPDFPTGGTIIANKQELINSYKNGKGGFKVRAKWEAEQLSHGLYQIVITEIPYQVQKSRLIEKIAELLKLKKLPLLANIRDESAEDIRVILEPKNRNCDPEALIESLCKLTELEVRFNMNLNVLDSNSVPRVMSLLEILNEFLQHRFTIITKRSKFLLQKVNHRLEILEGFKIAYLNLDEVIRIIREEENPKEQMQLKFELTEIQVEAILNMRLRSLHKLEELEIMKEHNKLSKEKTRLEKILNKPSECWLNVKQELTIIKEKFGYSNPIGKRKTMWQEEAQGQAKIIDIEAFIEREPITIFCSEKGWIRSIKGHNVTDALKYKDGDKERFVIKAYTTDKILFLSDSGKFFTIIADNITKGKGYGEPIRILIDLEDNDNLVDIKVFQPNVKYILASDNGKGFIAKSDDLIAQTKSGKQILNVTQGARALICHQIQGNLVAVIGENRKLLIFKIDEIPEMKRGQGVTLQKYKNAKLSDLITFEESEGLSWKLGDRIRIEKDIFSWLAKRGSIGKIPPVGFPKENKF